ncbi:MAG: hypothetical protein J1F36_00310 [Clostridiales bacterium]|nr:hypothetical protein [Clostridiales bacterium]
MNANSLGLEINTFKEINSMAEKGGIVFLGSDYFASLPIGELASVFNLNEKIFNRSLSGATIESIGKVLDDCVFKLQPSKIFVNLGEVETQNNMDISELICAYEWLLYTIHGKISADIYVISIMSDTGHAKEVNTALQRLCSEVNCKYIDITPALNFTKPNLHVFNIIKFYVHSHPLDFADIMSMR